MPVSIPESDWKKFGPLSNKALDRLCESILSEAVYIATDEAESMHDRYIALYKMLRKNDKEMANIFDGYSRSKATMQLAQMAAKGLISQEEIEQFSEEMQTFVQSFLDIGT